ncbi:hypothetical protein DASC09_011630 [Saccharomycopsis crataegensis]|uniref:RecF/RecN/SMC N-terminal domain-containing protein n=1 Tax=Saccharomycopsis crataegensis TaxID=43959 RepID=A0AAV5QI54_9ASCO|nr:hypothetical protein DASC09_011630 [Saccharomycopsis crataegensis]
MLSLQRSEDALVNFQQNDMDIDTYFSQGADEGRVSAMMARNEVMLSQIIDGGTGNINSNGGGSSDIAQIPAAAGIIEKIILQNFMCHEFFELELGPRLNFIIGRNGSGKSAILTGISVGLGSNAKDTDRGKSLKNLIKRGKELAKITIVLANKGDISESFKRDIYGDTITVERLLRTDEKNTYTIRSETGKVVSHKKSDLDEITEYFDITVNNPLSFLSQGEAKTFLSSSTDKDKYRYFMKGLQYDIVLAEYKHSWNQLAKVDLEIIEKHKHLKALDKDEKQAQKEFSLFHRSKNLRQFQKFYSGKLLWFEIESRKQDVKRLEKAKIQAISRVANSQELIIQGKENAELLRPKILKLTTDQEKYQEDIQHLDKEKTEVKTSLKDIERQLNIVDGKIQDLNDDISAKMQEKSKLQHKIKVEVKRLDSLSNGSRESIQSQLDLLEDRKRQHLQRKQELNEAIHGKQEAFGNMSRMISEELKERKTRISKLQQHKHDLHRFERDKFAPYGDKVEKVLKDIQKDHRFKSKPIGPLGFYMYIKPGHEKFSSLLEKILPTMAFVVQSFDDQTLLKGIFKKFSLNLRIIIRNFERFAYKTNPSEGQKRHVLSILDILKFANEDVKYTLIDVASIERIFLSDSQDEARCLVEENLYGISSCYSLFDSSSAKKFGKSMFGGFKSDPVYYLQNQLPKIRASSEPGGSGYQGEIRKIELQIEGDQIEINQFETHSHHERRSMQGEIDTLKLEYTRLKEDSVKVEKDIIKLQSQLENYDDDHQSRIEVLKSDVSNIDDEIRIKEYSLLDSETELQQLQQKFTEIEENLTTLAQKIGECSVSKLSINKELEDLKDEEEAIKETIENERRQVQKREIIANRIQDSIKTAKDEIVKFSQKAENYCSLSEAKIDFQTETLEGIKKQLDEFSKQASQISVQLGKPEEEILKNREAKMQEYRAARDELIMAGKLRKKLYRSMRNRKEASKLNRDMFCSLANTSFINSLNFRGFQGHLEFDFKNENLKMLVGKHGQEPREVTSLSGGEKSFTQIALLLSIWGPMRSRVRGLDEFDVFMDTVNRKISMDLILKNLRGSPKSQTIFITPLDVGHIKGLDSSQVDIHRLKDPIRRNQ